jgi:NitT/TauT family transport system permease protein
MLDRHRFRVADVRLPVSALSIVIVGWWAIVATLSVPMFLLPSPVTVASRQAGAPERFLHTA